MRQPAEEVEEPGDDAAGEAPQDDVAVSPMRKPGRGTSRSGCRTAIRSVRGDQLVEHHVMDLVHLGGRGDLDRMRVPPPAEHRGDGEVRRRQPELGQPAEHRRRRPGRPRSPPAPRAARPRPAVSPGSIVPPGKETWPGWERMSWARSVSSRSPPAASSPNSISTAPRRGLAPGGGRNAVRSCPRWRWRPPRPGAASPAGPTAANGSVTGSIPRCSSTSSTSSSTESRPPLCWSRSAAVGVDEHERREAAISGNGPSSWRSPQGSARRDRWRRCASPGRARPPV